MIHRRSLITGLVSLIAAPAIVRAASLMPLRGLPLDSGWILEAEGDHLGPLTPARLKDYARLIDDLKRDGTWPLLDQYWCFRWDRPVDLIALDRQISSQPSAP